MKNLTLEELQPLIIEWAKERNILFKENAPKQRLKLIEECGELASAVLKNDVEKQKDAIGDIFVVLVILNSQLEDNMGFISAHDCVYDNSFIISGLIKYYCYDNKTGVSLPIRILCENLNLDLTECANIAWNEIKNRTGVTRDGTFIKD